MEQDEEAGPIVVAEDEERGEDQDADGPGMRQDDERHNDQDAIDPRQDIQHTKTITAKDITTKDINGSYSYPLVGPRLEEAPDIDDSTLVQSTGADGSLVHSLDVMDKPLYSQHLEDDEQDDEWHDDQDAIDPRQDIQHAKTITAEDITAKDNTAKDTNGSYSYPLVGPRPEEAPDYDHGTLVMSTGTDGSLVHPLNVMDKTLRSHHLEHDEKDGERNDDQDATITAKDITAKDTGQRTRSRDPVNGTDEEGLGKGEAGQGNTEDRGAGLGGRELGKQEAGQGNTQDRGAGRDEAGPGDGARRQRGPRSGAKRYGKGRGS